MVRILFPTCAAELLTVGKSDLSELRRQGWKYSTGRKWQQFNYFVRILVVLTEILATLGGCV